MAHEMLKKKLAKMGRPPWQLMMTSVVADALPLNSDTNDALRRIFELFPHISTMTVQTIHGDVQVFRDFAGNQTAEVDEMLESIFQNDPSISGIIFPGTGTRGEHRATPDDRHCSPAGKALSEITAAQEAGELSRKEAIRRIQELYTDE
ncbi:MAG: hypothetical protein EON56_04775 [Alphaproteobacteria bacterium]|nr:MAG: hypothetical protein EON56_04775 [Alphaproteobacteria bacterium]